MSLPPDVIGFLQQLFFQQNRASGQYDDAVHSVTWFIGHCLSSFAITALACACLAVTVILLYRPRLTRGALWLPAFGLFGGTPTLYLHTRPASACGLFNHASRVRRAKSWLGRFSRHNTPLPRAVESTQ